MWDFNTSASQDKQQTPKQCHILILSFCISHCRHSLSPDLRGQLKLFLLFASGGLAVRKAVTDCCQREEEKKREKEGRSGKGRCSEHRRNQFRAQQYREEKSWAWTVRGRKVLRSESDGSDRSLLQWLFDPQLAWTITVKDLDVNHLPLCQQKLNDILI